MRNIFVVLLLISGFAGACAQPGPAGQPQPASQPHPAGVAYTFDGHYGQVEVGGRYAGAEFHRSRPLPSRVSFYYPVANSIDLSTDYWKRDASMPMAVGVQVDGSPRRFIGNEPWTYTVSPHRVVFERAEAAMRYRLSYEFCLNEPAMVVRMSVTNISGEAHEINLRTHCALSVRTCQTYAKKDSALTSYDMKNSLIRADFDDAETGEATLFIKNEGADPVAWSAAGEGLRSGDTGVSTWNVKAEQLSKSAHAKEKGIAAASFEYQQKIEPQESCEVVQIIGSCRRSELEAVAGRLAASWKENVDSYNEFVRLKSEQSSFFVTGDRWLDNSALYAKGILAANAHYLDSKIVPMPCPAEYNFYFTHDVLMTDLAAVNFDLPRVKNDLLYVRSRAANDIIPHAYYWRDDGFKTELCTPDNWNHFWFILLTGSYLRHSLDDSTGNLLYPLVTKSLTELLTQVKPDHLMYAFRPDWWDLGHIEGPRAYTTILMIRALREYCYVSSFLSRQTPKLSEYERLADQMQEALSAKLWNEDMGYLLNYNGEVRDDHYYMGSLLAGAYGLLDSLRSQKLIATAGTQLMAEKVGIRTAMPPDFHTQKSIDFYKFHGDEAGQPFLYINGGVWPHSNAWYALALNAAARKGEALEFVKSTMTVEGVMKSPMGQPAMFEYRYTDPSSAEYGRIDKPSFLWAGGFYLKTLYALFGVEENEWNISISPVIPPTIDSCRFTLEAGTSRSVSIAGNTLPSASLIDNNGPLYSRVIPSPPARSRTRQLRFGASAMPFLLAANAIVQGVSYDPSKRRFACDVRSFDGHRTRLVIAGKTPAAITIDGAGVKGKMTGVLTKEMVTTELRFDGTGRTQHVMVEF